MISTVNLLTGKKSSNEENHCFNDGENDDGDNNKGLYY